MGGTPSCHHLFPEKRTRCHGFDFKEAPRLCEKISGIEFRQIANQPVGWKYCDALIRAVEAGYQPFVERLDAIGFEPPGLAFLHKIDRRLETMVSVRYEELFPNHRPGNFLNQRGIGDNPDAMLDS